MAVNLFHIKKRSNIFNLKVLVTNYYEYLTNIVFLFVQSLIDYFIIEYKDNQQLHNTTKMICNIDSNIFQCDLLIFWAQRIHYNFIDIF